MPVSRTSERGRPERQITGRFVLACFIGFFGVIFLANAVMVRAALGTFGGVETESSYKAGLAFRQDETEAAAQRARGWQVEAHVERDRFTLGARDAQGRPLAGLALSASLRHPSDRRHDIEIAAVEDGSGHWTADPAAAPGQWDLVVVLTRDGVREFRSVNRIVLR